MEAVFVAEAVNWAVTQTPSLALISFTHQLDLRVWHQRASVHRMINRLSVS